MACAAFVTPAAALAQAPTFNALVSTSANTGSAFPEHATVGDFNGDGKPDAVLIDGSGMLRVMLGTGVLNTTTGYFNRRDVSVGDVTVNNVAGLPANLTSALPRPLGVGRVHAVDVNRDGKLDLVCATGASLNFAPYSFVSVLVNTGNDGSGLPQFAPTHHWSSFTDLRSIASGDLDGDGAPEIVIGGAHAEVRVWLNNGSGAFAAGQLTSLTPGVGQPAPGPSAIADLNGDGKADYVVTSTQNGGANIFFGAGNGTLQTPATFLANQAVSVAVADVNKDGKPDLLMGNLASNAQGLLVYLNNGGGSFAAPALYPIVGLSGSFNGGGSLALADINGDGELDAVLSNLSNNTIAVLLANGSGGFGPAHSFPANFAPTHLAVGDFTGDGKLDIATVLRNTRAYGVLTNTTVVVAPLPTQTLTILGGNGSAGGFATAVEYYNPATQQWQPAYLVGGHPWGVIAGTNSWINYKTSNLSDPGAGPSTNQTLWYTYRVRFTVPADAVEPKLTFSIKADNFARVAINGVLVGGATRIINNASVSNVIDGSADQLNADAVVSQAVHAGENTITLQVGDFGGLNGFNFRIDLSMKSSQPLDIVPVPTDSTPPVITSPGNLIREATSAAGATVAFTATAVDNVDGSVAVVASPASGSTFAIGTTSVGLAAADSAGNTASASFTVTVRDTTAPTLTVPANVTAEATSANGAVVTYAPATATDLVAANPAIGYSAQSGTTFALGTTTVNVAATDTFNNTANGSFTVTVRDTSAPVISSVTPSVATLWPPNHQMVPITVTVAATDNTGAFTARIKSVTSNEPDNGLGDGDTANDIQNIDGLKVSLRAERAAKGDGRVYMITVEVVDSYGNASTRTCTVSVPRNQSGK